MVMPAVFCSVIDLPLFLVYTTFPVIVGIAVLFDYLHSKRFLSSIAIYLIQLKPFG